MAADRGTSLDKNPFERSMTYIKTAAEISQSVTDALYAKRLTDTRIMTLYTYMDALNAPFQVQAAQQTSDVIGKISSTKAVVTKVMGIQPELTDWVRQIDAQYHKGTTRYNDLLIGGLTSFYTGTRSQRLNRINALITGIGTDALLAMLKAQIIAFYDGFWQIKPIRQVKKRL